MVGRGLPASRWWAGEGPRRRRPAPASTRSASRSRADPAVTALVCAPGNAGTADGRRAARRSTSPTRPRSPRWPPSCGPTSSSSAPRCRWSPASPTRSGPPASPASARPPRRPGSRAPRRSPRTSWPRPACRPRGARLHDRRRGRRRARRVRPAVRGQGRRAGRRQGRRGHRRPGRRAGARRRAAGTVVVEEYLDGPEVSLFCVTDGDDRACRCCRRRTSSGSATATPGPNTGGMGAYAPLPWAPAGLVDDVLATRRPARRSPRWRAAARRSPGCSTSGWR